MESVLGGGAVGPRAHSWPRRPSAMYVLPVDMRRQACDMTCGSLARVTRPSGAGGLVGAAGEAAGARDGLVMLAATWDARDPPGAASLTDGSRRPMGCTKRP